MSSQSVFDTGETGLMYVSMDAPASASRDSLGGSEPPAPNSQMLQIILLQHADGHWKLDETLAEHLGIELEDLVRRLAELTELAQHPAAEIESCWATTLALVFLETRHAEDKDEWALVAAKARTWLAAAALPVLSLDQLREHAEDVIGGE